MDVSVAVVLGDTDDTTTYRDAKTIAIFLSILHLWRNLLMRCFRNFARQLQKLRYDVW